MTKTNITKPHIFQWTPARLKAAKLAASTTMTQEQIAVECGVRRETVNEWFQAQEFKEKVAELIMQDERFTKPGLLKITGAILDKKIARAAEDRSTAADYIKIVADIAGINKQGNEINIYNAVGVVNTQEVKDAVSRLCEKLREADDSTD